MNNLTPAFDAKSIDDQVSSLFYSFENHDNEEGSEDDDIVEQFVQTVEDFSSQYGSDISVSYTAFNLRGQPSNFPDYGDFPQSFVMRTYGPWWDEAPSGVAEYVPQNHGDILSQDFVEVAFERPVFPHSIRLFETYNPGALVRVWAKGPRRWHMLWEESPQLVRHRPRIFTPVISETSFATRIFRLEFNHSLLSYYSELDAVLLKGKREGNNKMKFKNNFCYTSLFTDKIQGSLGKDTLIDRILAFHVQESMSNEARRDKQVAEVSDTPSGAFHFLPDETILSILAYLDLKTLSCCLRVNKHFNRLASDPILYKRIGLKPYWYAVDSNMLRSLVLRCKFVKRLDLSWCGSYGTITAVEFIRFIESCGAGLTHLRLNCCRFVDDSVLKALVNVCTNLQELCVRSCIGPTNWKPLARLKELRRLDLYRTRITSHAAIAIVYSNKALQHINLGACSQILVMDEVVTAIGENCADLRSIDMWKSHTLTTYGVRALARCKNLREIDVGWCLHIGGSGDWLSSLSGCGELRKLFLAALRGVSDRDLRPLLCRWPHLQQMDLLGVRNITADICSIILSQCCELKLLDVSFCDQISESQVLAWRAAYPQVSIKYSFQMERGLPSPDSFSVD